MVLEGLRLLLLLLLLLLLWPRGRAWCGVKVTKVDAGVREGNGRLELEASAVGN